MDWTHLTFLGNELWRYAALSGALLLPYIGGKFAGFILLRASAHLPESRRALAAFLRAVGQGLGWLACSLGAVVGVSFLKLGPEFRDLVDTTSALFLLSGIAYLAWRLVDVPHAWLSDTAARSRNKLDDMLVPIVRTSLRGLVLLLAVVQAAQILSDQPVSSILAGLGIGGIAVAMAAQGTLSNFFGSVAIFTDKPFQIGDRIVVNEVDGHVEMVGFRSTRIRTLDGHSVTVPNANLAASSISNITRRPFIRRVLTLTVTYDTPPERLDRAMAIVAEILRDRPGLDPANPPRIFFSDFGECSLNLIVYYWFTPPDLWKSLEFNSAVNREILERFNREGIEFAFPTRTLYLAGDPKRPFPVDRGPVLP